MSFILVLLTMLFCSFASPGVTGAQANEIDILRMYYDDRDLEVGVTRNAVPLSAVAETVTVITADEIRAMNAHTIADVLSTVTGLQQEVRGGPGFVNSIYIRGGGFQHVRVLLDGVTVNNIESTVADLDAIPAHIVERIEIMKGPASSSWGSALGGVVSIITKTPSADRPLAGTVNVAGGEAGFRDVNLQLSGSLDQVDYYAFAGHLGENGLTRRSSADNLSAYGKFNWSTSYRASLTGTLLFIQPERSAGGGIVSTIDSAQLITALTAKYSLLDSLDIELMGRAAFQDFRRADTYFIVGPDPVNQTLRSNAHSIGGSAILRWRSEIQSLVLGFDYDAADYRQTGSDRKDLLRAGVFLTDTIRLGSVSITPGGRYDWTNEVLSRKKLSSSLGIAWAVSDGTILRVSAAKGYNLPEIVDPDIVKIWSVQAGVETTEVPYFWLRGTFFYNDVRNTWVFGQGFDDVRRIGGEIELRTMPVFNLSLTGGVMVMSSESLNTGKTVGEEPRTSWNVGLRYDDGKGLQGCLLGHQIDWNAVGKVSVFDFKPRSGDFIWDFHISKKLRIDTVINPELFFSLHNIFDGDQYLYQYWKNPGRWAEGGIRFSF